MAIWRRAINVGAIALFIIFSIGGFLLIGSSSPSYKQCIGQHGQTQNETLSFFACQAHFADENNGLITALATVVVATFTIVLAYSTRRQASLTRDAIELGTREFLATHRPKIRVRYIDTTHLTKDTRHPATITVSNIGYTDATVVAMGIDIFVRGQQFNATPQPLKDKILIASGKEARIDVLGSRPITLTEIQQVGAGSQELWLLGIIRYRDRNNIERNTSVFRVYNNVYSRFERASQHHEFAEREYED